MTYEQTAATVHGRMLFKKARELGWHDSIGEGPYEYVVRMAYEQGHEDARREAKGER